MEELLFLHFALPLMAVYQSIKFHLISLYTFRDMLRTSFFIAKIKKGSNSVNTGENVMVLAFCNSLHSPLSLYQISYNYLQYFQRYAPDKLTTAKIRKGNNSKITCDRVTVLAFALPLIAVYQCIKFHLIPFCAFRDMLRTSFFTAKLSVSSFIELISILLEVCSGQKCD